jgi:hypothetical protein
MLRHEGYGRNAGKLPDQVSHHFDLLRTAPMNRHQDGVNRPFPDNPNGIGNRIPVNHRKTAAPRGIYPGPLHRQQHRGHRGGALS